MSFCVYTENQREEGRPTLNEGGLLTAMLVYPAQLMHVAIEILFFLFVYANGRSHTCSAQLTVSYVSCLSQGDISLKTVLKLMIITKSLVLIGEAWSCFILFGPRLSLN